MKKFLIIQGAVKEFNEDDPNIEPMVVAGALERCREDGADYFTGLEPGEAPPPIEDDGSDHYYRLTKARNFTVHETEDLIQALWTI